MSACVGRASLVRLTTACCRTSRTLSTSAARAGARQDQVIHTGQQWDESDPRSVRFAVTGLTKEVNTKWAIDLIAEQPVIQVSTRIVSCDGGGGPLGHPKVYINLDKPGPQSCPYCGLRYEFVPYEQLAAASTERET